MNCALKAAALNQQTHLINFRPAFFHSTPVLERKRRNYWQPPRSSQYTNPYSKRFRRNQSKKTLLRNIGSYAEHLFQSWREDNDDDDPSAMKGPSWFRNHYINISRKGRGQARQQWDRRFHFCEDEDEVEVDMENIFGSVFGRSKCFYWSFINEENNKWRSSSSYDFKYWNSRNWRSRFEEEYESYTESESLDSAMASHRQALGLSASGPIKLEDVKNAYRACALKWHPDRHQGSSKAVAEEKFKLCSAAYQSLCDKLAVN